MKVSMIISVLSSIALPNPASSAPVSNVAENAADLVSSPMFWIGIPIPGGLEVRLNGTAKEILEQIKEINPKIEEGPVPTPTTVEENPTRVKCYFQGCPTCNLVVGGHAKNVPLFEEVIPYLWRLGAITSQIAGAAEEIRKECETPGVSQLTYIVTGQWSDTTGYNVVIRSHNY
ncbi:uncharacterized protein DFL_003464 [Arthrobotrys flagrans]|uniref:Killer toxin Kp4 domain-containing protein n=1 Tax=Arthrobotrys flagrans TaxID=97331 RepID=A0A437A1W3_ARTFL|nr:hypothetical protein DFL_003464 [Arthrobotrys flagrans]